MAQEIVIYKTIAESFALIQQAESNKKSLITEINDKKIKGYAFLIAAFNAEGMKKKTKRAGEIKEYLIQNGVSKACAKRYMENGQEAMKFFKDKNPEMVLKSMQEREITTEAELKALCFPKEEESFDDKLQKIADKFIREMKVDFKDMEIAAEWSNTCVRAFDAANKAIKTEVLKVVAIQPKEKTAK